MRPIQEPKNKNTPKIATFLRLRIVTGRQNTDEARKNGKLDAQRPIFASQGTERSPQSQKKLHRSRNSCFCETDRRSGAYLAKDECASEADRAKQHHGVLRHQPGKAVAPPGKDQALVRLNSPRQKSRTNPAEKCNIRRETMGKTSEIAGNY